MMAYEKITSEDNAATLPTPGRLMMNVLKRDLKPLCALTSLRSLSRRTSCKYAKGPAALRL